MQIDRLEPDPPADADAHASGGHLSIDLAAIAANYGRIRASTTATCAAVVKADAYGLGVDRVAPALLEAGCRDFFVAHLDEGIRLRDILGAGPRIAVLHGAPPGAEDVCRAADLVPVINSLDHLSAWKASARAAGTPQPAMLQIDTGLSRFGFSGTDLERLAAAPDALDGIALRLVMSHLACAGEPDHPANAAQLLAFDRARALFPGVPASLAASSGIALGPRYHFDLVRPGASLYGVNPQPGRPNPMVPVIRLRARIVQTRSVETGTGIGYGHTAAAPGPMRLAIVSAGYADGILRSASGAMAAWAGPIRLPVVGRVSMDSIIVDLGDTDPSSVMAGDFVHLVGPHQDLDALAETAGTIGYEILTALGARYHRTFRSTGRRPGA